MNDYEKFLHGKSQTNVMQGFDPLWIPDFLFPFQKCLVDWAVRKGKAAIYADCGLGKTPLQLVWAENVVRKTNKPVLVLTPLAVSAQTVREGEKFGIECRQSRDGKVVKGINVTNYERLHYFDPDQFSGVVCDESSAIKMFGSKRQKGVTEFLRRMQYRLLCTATAAPNDFIELGTSSEALGQMGRMDMLGTFFLNDEDSLHPIWWGARWRMKKHAEKVFWRWVCSWARALRKPSDLGFDDRGFDLPPLKYHQHIVESPLEREGFGLLEAVTMKEQRAEQRATIEARCEKVTELLKTGTAVAWCHLNPEGDLLRKFIKGSEQVSGSDRDEEKEEKFLAFSQGQIRCLVTKPKIGCFGLNWQHCNLMTFFPTHSYEQMYQSVRRCWRFGQKKPVNVHVVTTPGETRILRNMERKSANADKMFSELIRYMNEAMTINKDKTHDKKVKAPQWL